MKRLLNLIGGFKILKLQPLLKNWSFVCIAQKIEETEKDYMEIDCSKITLNMKYLYCKNKL